MSVHPMNATTFIEVVQLWTQQKPHERAFCYLEDGETDEACISFSELDEKARAIAAVLQDHRLAGERALLLFPPGLHFIPAFLGCLYAGVIAVPLQLPPLRHLERALPKIRAVASDCQARAALTTSDRLSMVEQLNTIAPDLKNLIWISTNNLAEDMARQWHYPLLKSESLAFLQYTSGSTAAPKGVMVSHANILYNERMIRVAFEHTEQSTVVGWLPLFHDMGLIGNVLQPLYLGAESILMSPVAFLQKPFRWLQAISRYKARTSGGPNFAYELCTRKVTDEQRTQLDLNSWEVAFNGAEPILKQTLDDFLAAFHPCGFHPEAFYPCYGLAEITLFASGDLKSVTPVTIALDRAALEQNQVVERSNGHQLVSSGRAWLDRRIVIVDPESRLQSAPGSVGEIWLAGNDVALGYWGHPDVTQETFNAYLADSGEGPFLRTGDLGFLKDGNLFVTGRLKDLIIIAGRNHYPQDIERTVSGCHPAIRPSCVAAFSVNKDAVERLVVVAEVERHLRLGAVNMAADSQESASVSPATIIRAIRQAIAEMHDLHVEEVVLIKIGTLPKTSSGKIQRNACRAKLLAGQLEIIVHERAQDLDRRIPVT